MSITVYSAPGCGECGASRQLLDELPRRDPDRFGGLTYETVNVVEDVQACDFVLGLGYREVPVVVVSGADDVIVDHWAGHRPSRLVRATERVVAGERG